jgi:[protein-PII] uridylyltransferase
MHIKGIGYSFFPYIKGILKKRTMKSVKELKNRYEEKKAALVELHHAGTEGIRISLALTERLDWLLKSIFASLTAEQQAPFAVVALGGYGRNELCFASDADILFLVADENTKATGALAANDFLHLLLDVGVDVGHSFRTIQECLDITKTAVEPMMSLMEARLVCGNIFVFKEFQKQMRTLIQERSPEDFIRLLSHIQNERHAKYGNSAKLLEPNVKNSAGGLRDLHTVLWLMYGTGCCDLPEQIEKTTAVSTLLFSPAILYISTRTYSREILEAFDFLLRVRNEMHLQSSSIHDILEFGFQQQVAEGLHYKTTAKLTNVEHFMHDYHSAAKTIARFSSRILDWAKDEWRLEKHSTAIRALNKDYFIRSQKINLHTHSGHITTGMILEAYIACCQLDLRFSFELENTIYRAAPKLRPLRTKEEAVLFRTLLNQEQGVARSFRSMADLGLLERWIPEWKPMVSFFQHNQYHFYTADEHTLLALANAEALASSSSQFGAAFRQIPKRDILYLSCLFHDIAKPLHIGKHEIAGVKIARQVLERLQYEDIIPDVSFLVRHHLTMEQVAFRRNLNDTLTIVQYASMFKNIQHLSYLYLLTYADLSAVNRSVLTQWKELLLTELYTKTKRLLDQHLTPEEAGRQSVQQNTDRMNRVIEKLHPVFQESEICAHLRQIEEPGYFTLFSPEEIGSHIAALRTLDGIAVLFHSTEEFTEVTVLAPDAPYALSKFCGVLTANDADIFDAQIITRTDGIIIDKFRVVDFLSKLSLPESICQRITKELRDVMQGTVELSALLERHRSKWKRRTQPPNPNVRYDVQFGEHPNCTIIDIYAADTLGFLHAITTTISGLGLNITFAKIASRVDGIVDSFYVLDGSGKKIADPERLSTIRTALLASINELSESELVVNNSGTGK